MRYVLLDANIIIYAFDCADKDNQQHKDAVQKIRDCLADENTKLAITPLIRYEVLRGVSSISAEDMQEILNDFEEFNINEDIAVRCAKLFHTMPKKDDMNQLEKKNYKHNFDIFHYVVSEMYDLEFISEDTDLLKIAGHAKSIS